MTQSKKNKNLTTGIVIVVLIIVITVSTAYYQQVSNYSYLFTESEMNSSAKGEYQDGVYRVNGNYISPGGIEQIEVSITLEDGIITDSEVVPLATREISVEKQNDFAENYKPLVIGKNIDEVNLTKVSGSSLTPRGFNNALEKIKGQARS